jgi:hypothetical protein
MAEPVVHAGDILQNRIDQPQPMTSDDYRKLLQEVVPDYDDLPAEYEEVEKAVVPHGLPDLDEGVDTPEVGPTPPEAQMPAFPIGPEEAVPIPTVDISQDPVVKTEPDVAPPPAVGGDEILAGQFKQTEPLEHWTDKPRPEVEDHEYFPPEPREEDVGTGERRMPDEVTADVGDDPVAQVEQGDLPVDMDTSMPPLQPGPSPPPKIGSQQIGPTPAPQIHTPAPGVTTAFQQQMLQQDLARDHARWAEERDLRDRQAWTEEHGPGGRRGVPMDTSPPTGPPPGMPPLQPGPSPPNLPGSQQIGTTPTPQILQPAAGATTALTGIHGTTADTGTAAAIAHLQSLYGANWQNYWSGPGGGGIPPPGPPGGSGPPPAAPSGPPGAIPTGMPWLQNPRTGQLLTRPGQIRIGPTIPGIPPTQITRPRPGATSNLQDILRRQRIIQEREEKKKKKKKFIGKSGIFKGYVPPKPDPKPIPPVVIEEEKKKEDPPPLPPLSPVSVRKKRRKDDPPPLPPISDFSEPSPPPTVRFEEQKDIKPPLPPFSDISMKSGTKTIPPYPDTSMPTAPTLKGLPSIPEPPKSLRPAEKRRYYLKLKRLGFRVPQQQQAAGPIIVQGAGGGGSSSAGGAGGSGAGGAASGGLGQRRDPRTEQALRAAMAALRETRQSNAKKRLTSQARKQVTAKRKEYLAVRKQKLKAILERQKAELKTVTQQVKSLPKKQRTAKSKALRAAIRAKYKKIKDRIPPSAKKSMGELVNLIKTAKVLRV